MVHGSVLMSIVAVSTAFMMLHHPACAQALPKAGIVPIGAARQR